MGESKSHLPRGPLTPGEALIFELELDHQCRLAIRAATEMELSLALGEHERFWFTLHSLLTTTGNISKLLWGSRRGREGQRALLRERLGIADDSPIRSRTLRDHFEHFD